MSDFTYRVVPPKYNAAKGLPPRFKYRKRSNIRWRIRGEGEGYLCAEILCRDGSYIEVRWHRLILEVALGRKLSPSEDAHHKDGNKRNNAPTNLEPIDHVAHAQQHAYARRPRGSQHFVKGGASWSNTHCPNGHEYTASNTRVRRDQSRTCLQCERNRERNRKPGRYSKTAIALRGASPGAI